MAVKIKKSFLLKLIKEYKNNDFICLSELLSDAELKYGYDGYYDNISWCYCDHDE